MAPEIVIGLFTLLGAAIGAILTGLFSSHQRNKNRSRKELSIFTGHTARLIEVDSSISKIVEIRVRGQRVPTVYTLDTRIVNTGTEPLHEGDINVALVGDAKFLAVDIAEFSPGAPDALTLELDKRAENFRVHFHYINPGEEFLLRALLSASASSIEPTFRQPGVITRVQTDFNPTMPRIWERILFEAIRGNFLLHFFFIFWFEPYKRYLAQVEKDG